MVPKKRQPDYFIEINQDSLYMKNPKGELIYKESLENETKLNEAIEYDKL